MVKNMGAQDDEKTLKEAFQILDLDDSGSIDREELRTIMRNFSKATEKIAESKTRISELTAQMNTMIAKKVGPNTTVDDVYAAYPEIEKEIDDEIDQHQWSKDI